jgi:acetamidase/formamidase
VTKHVVRPDRYHLTFATHEPAVRIADGDSVETTILDGDGRDERFEQVMPPGNALTGPFFVEGAEPGDTLAVTIERLTPNREMGVSSACLGPGVVDPETVRDLPDPAFHETVARWRCGVNERTVTLIAPETRATGMVIPMSPMLGCFGVAPADSQAISAVTCGAHGGNMDYRGFTAGTTVYFPVLASGGLFFAGDGHAAQGDGEIAGSGIEISMNLEFTVRLRRKYVIGWPRAETTEYILTVGNARPLDQAVQHATSEMFRWLQADFGLDGLASSLLLGQCAEYDLGNMYSPAYTMVCKVPKGVLAQGRPQPSATDV